MNKIIVAFVLIVFLAGCRSPMEMGLDGLTKPVYIAAISVSGEDKGVLLRDAKGKSLFFPEDYNIARTILSSGLKTGDVLIPVIPSSDSQGK